MSDRVLITGGTGFAGSHLIEYLLAQGQTDIHTTSFGSSTGFVHEILPSDHIHKVDLTSGEATSALLTKLQPTVIYHLAAFATVGTSFGQAANVLENNLKLQLSLLEAVKASATKPRVLVVGSGMEYDVLLAQAERPQANPLLLSELDRLGPISPYAVSKVMQDLLGLSYHYSYSLDIVRARPFNHIGERQTDEFAIPSFAAQIVAVEQGKKQQLEVGNLSAVRDFTDVKDVVVAYKLLIEQGKNGEVYNIGSGRGSTMQEILDQLCALSTTTIKVVSDPAKFRPLDVPSMVADNGKIAALGWQPRIALADTLQRIVEYWRNNS
jgi:GDP-4-dehydro-6-deoxy-D-mannose reductase